MLPCDESPRQGRGRRAGFVLVPPGALLAEQTEGGLSPPGTPRALLQGGNKSPLCPWHGRVWGLGGLGSLSEGCCCMARDSPALGAVGQAGSVQHQIKGMAPEQ